MHFSPLILALTVVLASAMTAADSSKEFTINMETNDGYKPLALIKNGTHGQYVLEVSKAGTPAYYTGTGMYKNLFMTLDCDTYGLEAPEVGDDYGYAGAVFGVKGGHQKQWIVDKYGISHELQAALNSLYACKDHANGKPGVFLKFGTPQSPNLYPPVGCDPTELKPDFDVKS